MNAQINHCSYCDNLIPAIEGDNYCSHKSLDVDSIDSNAFYFATNELSSGQHTSRFTIRSIENGYQSYQIDGNSNMLKNDNLLIVNQGSVFENHLKQEGKAEGITLAFNSNFIDYYLYFINNKIEELLERPFDKSKAHLKFSNTSLQKTPRLRSLLRSLMRDVRTGDKDSLYFQEVFLKVLNEIVHIESAFRDKVSKIKALKKSTREELFYRISKAKDYIDSNLNQQLSLPKIAQESYLSPFHFLRTFSDLYDITPYQYIKSERLKKAKFNIRNSKDSLDQIMTEVGFENNRTFQRSFQKEYGLSAHQYMLSHRNKKN